MDSEVDQLLSQAESLSDKFKEGAGGCYIEEAIKLDRLALELCPLGHDMRWFSLNQLALHLRMQYSQTGDVGDIKDAIAFDKEALELLPLGHPDRSISLNNFAISLWSRYQQLGSIDDLSKSISLDQEALELRPHGHPLRVSSLRGLADGLHERYKQIGDTEDLDNAITFAHEALSLCPQGYADRPDCLNNLAIYLSNRYTQLGVTGDLINAIDLAQEVLSLHQPGHPSHWYSLTNLAMYLHIRYERFGALEDIDEAISLNRKALALQPLGHPGRPHSLSNLADDLHSRHKHFDAMDNLTEAIERDEAALEACSTGHPQRSWVLNNYADHLTTRYKHFKNMDDLNESIRLAQDAVELRPPGHPDRPKSLNILADNLHTRYKEQGQIQDLNEAARVAHDALVLCPSGHSQRPRSLQNLACYFRARFTQSGEPGTKEELFSLYALLPCTPETVSSAGLSVSKSWVHDAEHFHHSTLLQAYQTSLQLLIHYSATLPSLPRHLSLMKDLTSSLPVDALSACLRNCSPTDAVELLEQGRSVFWNQLARLRYPVDDVAGSGPEGKMLADEFTQLASYIRDALHSSDPDQHGRVWRLNVDLQRVVSQIRRLPNLSRFLLPSLFPHLKQAASGGPVIIVNASRYSCDALIVFLDRDPVHIPLPHITRDHARTLSLKIHTLTTLAKTVDVTRDLKIKLREIWDNIVSPIVDVLLGILPFQSRIWWCPTSEFCLLPFHAAGSYRVGKRRLADIYISSYTPSLGALIQVQRCPPSNPQSHAKRFVAIGQAKARGETELQTVGTELACIGARVGGLATFTSMEGSKACISQVVDALEKNEWVHSACHGLPNRKRPFESAFGLHDGHLAVQRIIQCELKNAEFAYLSACHTTVGYEDGPDEMIHLAAAMQFAGFRSVIGTMWGVDDNQANKITSTFYDNMTDKLGRLDHTHAASALHKTIMEVKGISFDQQILYVHLGA